MNSKPRGIVLISILVLTLLGTFFIGALIQMNPSRLQRTVHDEKRDRAAMAAKAGVDYVLNRLRADWEESFDANQTVVETEGLVVREDHGNILGWIRPDGESEWVGFRVRFNLQDGSDRPSYPISSKQISLNNLADNNPQQLPVGVGSNFEADIQASEMAVAPNSVALLAEGVSLPGLSPDQPDSLAQATTGTVRTVEGLYIISKVTDGVDGDAVLMTGGNAKLKLGPSDTSHPLYGFFELMADASNSAGVRNKGHLDLSREGRPSTDGVMFRPDQRASVDSHNKQFQARLEDRTFEGGSEDINAPFLKLQASNVFDREGSSTSIPGGVYVFKNGNLNDRNSLTDNVAYFNMTWTDYRTQKINGNSPQPSEVPTAFLDMVTLDSKDVTIDGVSEKRDVVTITQNVKVQGGSADLAIVPERGAKQFAGDSAGNSGGTSVADTLFIPSAADDADKTVPQDIEVVFSPPDGESAFLTNKNGNVFIGTHISGKGGGIASAGDLNLVGLGIDLETRPSGVEKDGVAFFAGDDSKHNSGSINLSTYDERRNRFWDVDIAGTIYAGKDLNVRLGQESVSNGVDAPQWGLFKFAGAIVSLGDAQYRETGLETGDTNAFSGGTSSFTQADTGSAWSGNTSYSPTAGHTDMTAAGISLFYDPRFLAPYIEKTQIRPTFAAISVVER